MPYLILLLLILAFLIWRMRGGGGLAPPRRKQCDWVCRDSDAAGLRAFRCQTCGVTGYSGRANGPEDCKRDLGKHGKPL